MPFIILKTHIEAPLERVFDLARSIDLHQDTTGNTQEKAIAGRTAGLLKLNETVTWRARHFGVFQTLSVIMLKLERPTYFMDQMLTGIFKEMTHTHRFEQIGDLCLMTDEFLYLSPLGFLGRLADELFLKKYMTRFLTERNEGIKRIAEGEEWKQYLK